MAKQANFELEIWRCERGHLRLVLPDFTPYSEGEPNRCGADVGRSRGGRLYCRLPIERLFIVSEAHRKGRGEKMARKLSGGLAHPDYTREVDK